MNRETNRQQSRHVSKTASSFSTPRAKRDSLTPEISTLYRRFIRTRPLAAAVLSSGGRDYMFKISTVDTNRERRLVVEGTLVNPWVSELRRTWGAAAIALEGRSLVIDLSNATLIDREGEGAILELMQDGAKFCCRGVLTKHVLKQLAQKCHTGLSDVLERRSAKNKEEEG
jgi:hypothetical protein